MVVSVGAFDWSNKLLAMERTVGPSESRYLILFLFGICLYLSLRYKYWIGLHCLPANVRTDFEKSVM